MAAMKKRARDAASRKFTSSPVSARKKKQWRKSKEIGDACNRGGVEATLAVEVEKHNNDRIGAVAVAVVRKRLGRPRTKPPKEGKEKKMLELSIIVSVCGTDIDVALLDRVQEFLSKETMTGKCSLERGGLAFHLHFQTVICILAISMVGVTKLLKGYLSWQENKPVGAVVICKSLTQKGLHTFIGMVGDCMKDAEQDHFRTLDHNISVDDLKAGMEELALHGQEEGKCKIILTQCNFALKCQALRRWKNKHPAILDWDTEFFKMLKSEKYYPCTSWIVGSFGRGYEPHRMRGYWKMLVMPTTITPRMLRMYSASLRYMACKG